MLGVNPWALPYFFKAAPRLRWYAKSKTSVSSYSKVLEAMPSSWLCRTKLHQRYDDPFPFTGATTSFILRRNPSDGRRYRQNITSICRAIPIKFLLKAFIAIKAVTSQRTGSRDLGGDSLRQPLRLCPVRGSKVMEGDFNWGRKWIRAATTYWPVLTSSPS